jgi:RecB family exonuclease
MIPDDFTFSQHSLTDFNTCQWRFYLRDLKRVAWPAAEMRNQAAADLRQEQGVNFHLRAMQYYSGLPAESLTGSSSDTDLEDWWSDFLKMEQRLPFRTNASSGWRLNPEMQLSARLGNYRLTGKFDLLAVLPGAACQIYDWKTGSRPPAREALENHPQTLLYRWLAVTAGGAALGLKPAAFTAEQVSMTYWYAGQPGTLISLDYSAEQYQNDQADLLSLLDYINSLPEDGFRKTDDTRACRFCVYRSYCERGYQPGSADAAEESPLSVELPSWDEINPQEP